MRTRIVLLGFLGSLVVPAGDATGHSGGLDGCGCHAGSRPYHCHRNPCYACPGSFDCRGSVKIVAIPRARVVIDGKDVGMSPTKAIPAQHGQVTVQLQHSILGTHEVSVEIEYGRTTTQMIRW